MTIANWCERVIRTGFILLFTLVPLLLTPWNYELFEYNKMIATYALTVIIVGAWIIKMIDQKQIRIAKTPLDIPIALFFVSQLVSALFSIDHHVSWFGYYSRFNGGMWSVVSYILLYYALLSNLANWSNLVIAATASGTIVAIYGVLERLGIDKHLWVQDVQNRVFSTLGQPNWLAAYLVALIPISSGLALKIQNPKSKIQTFVWLAVSALFFAVLLFTRSRSGLVGFAVADLVFWGLLFAKTRDFVRIRVPFVICHLSFVILVAIFGTSIDSIDQFINKTTKQQSDKVTEATVSAYTAPLLEYGGTESGTIRKYVWQGAMTAWQSSVKTMLIGTGTETFAFAFYQYRPQGHNLTSEWDFLYNKAHNEYLNYLTTTGILGLGSYVLLIGAFIYWFVKIQMTKSLPRRQAGKIQNSDTQTLEIALFSGWASILVTNFFGFSVVILQLFFFLIPALLLSTSSRSFRTKPINASKPFLWFVLGGSVVIIGIIVSHWWGDMLFARGYRGARLGQYLEAREALSAALAINPFEPLYHDEAASTLSLLATIAIENRDATAASQLARESIRESDEAIRISPNNVNYWKTRTKILYAFAPFDPTFIKAAITALEKAGTLSPNDPKILYNLAVLYGQDGNNDRAIELLKKAIDLKRNYRDAYWALHVFYNEIGQSELAKSALNEYLSKVDPNDGEFLDQMK